MRMKYNILNLMQLKCLLTPVLPQIPVLILLVIFTLTGCKSDDGDEPGLGDDSFTAMVDGVPYIATEIYDAGYKDNGENLFIVSANSSNTIEIEIDGIEPGEYTISGDYNNGGLYTIKATQEIFSTQFGGTGKINLQELTSSRLKGTFSFTVSPIFTQRNAENTIVIEDGEFDVAIQ